MAAGADANIHPLEGTSPTGPHRQSAGVKAGTATGTATRRRAKSFLRNYYGIQQADAANQDGSKDSPSAPSGPTSKADPYDLDSHAFEVDKYMHKMFVEKQLPGLVQADNELVADIRQLDGDMKTLVYENYSKFLSATDTINKMKSNVDNLESEMARLTQNIGKIATSSSAIHSSLGGKREKIRQLNGVHSLLTKLQFVFELPTNLHQCLETESYTQAVKSYCRTLHLLQHYKHLTVFTGIERECKAIMIKVAQKIRQKMRADQATITEITESVGLLLALKEDPVSLWKQYLDLSMKALRKVNTKTLEDVKALPLYSAPPVASPKSAQTSTPATPRRSAKKSAKSAATTASGAGSAEKEKETKVKTVSTPPADKVAYLNAYFLKQFEAFVVSFMNYFLIPTTAPGTPANTSSGSGGMVVSASNEETTGSDQRPPAWVAKDTRVHANLTREQISEASTTVKEAASNMISKYLDTIRSFLDYPEDIFSIQPRVHVHVLQNLYLGTKSSSGLCQLIGFDTLATGLIQNWESQLIERALGKVKQGLMSKIIQQNSQLAQQSFKSSTATTTTTAGDVSLSLAEPISNTASAPVFGWATVLKETTVWLLDSFKVDTVPFLEKCMSSDAQFLETTEGRALFLKNFQDEFKAFWDWILKEMQKRSSAIPPSPPSLSSESSESRTSSLVMSQLCFEFSASVVEQLYKTLSKTLFRVGKRNRSGSFLVESYEEPPVLPQLQWDCKSVIQACQESGHILLDGFIARTGNELSWLVMDVRSETDFMTFESPPTGVSVAWETIYRQLNEIERQVVMVYGDEGERLGNHDISSESTRRESAFRPGGGGGGGGVGGGGAGGSHSGSRPSHRNDSLASFGSNTMNSRFDHQQRNLLLSNIDKLFSDRVEIFIRCQDLNRTGIMFGIIKILLKAWAESVRMKTFGKGGFQQVQVDAEFAKVWLWRFATADERLMHSLLEEAQQTAYRRCIDALPLDLHAIESIINSFER
ncbi:MAG: hypothetical protein J3R72DRAFT_431592 [Linnemannia gamsii]|nr:MAG: hypothetical protein J3R72DRAFT_431592 [Linnemannia gamsii]